MKESKTTYLDDRRIDITAYLGPRRAGKQIYNREYGTYPLDPEEGYPSFITDEVFQLYKAAGMNFLMPEGDAFYGVRVTKDGFVSEPDFEKSDLYHYMKVAERNGLGVYPAAEEIFGHMAHEEGPFGEKEKAILKDFVTTIQKHFPDTFWGIMLTDEPCYNVLSRIKKILDYLHSDEIQKIKPNIDSYISMHPIYGAKVACNLDRKDPKYKKVAYGQPLVEAYGHYLDTCAEVTGGLSVDYYALVYETQIMPNFYLNLEMMAERCKERNCLLTVTLQSFRMDIFYSHKTGRGRILYRTPHYEDVRWQVYSALAFGAGRLGYYTFWSHYSIGVDLVHTNAMVVYDPSDENGYRTTEIYDAVKAVNQEILAFDHVFLRFKWQGCSVIRTSRDRNIRLVRADYKDNAFRIVKATRDTLIGHMENPENNAKGYWIVNAENPIREQNNDVELLFADAKRLTYYRKGKEFDAALEHVIIDGKQYGKFVMRLGVGEGVFCLPY